MKGTIKIVGGFGLAYLLFDFGYRLGESQILGHFAAEESMGNHPSANGVMECLKNRYSTIGKILYYLSNNHKETYLEKYYKKES